MKQPLLRWLLAPLLLALFCCEEKRDPTQWPMAREELERHPARESGAELNYRRYCIGCHGDDGRGGEGTTGADLTAIDGPLARRSDAELASSVREGKRGASATMPPHKPVLNDAQIAALIAYVRERFQPASAARADGGSQ
jgi:mono/diheme cytochrome c family protein